MICVYIYMKISLCIHICIYVYAYRNTCTYLCLYIYIYSHNDNTNRNTVMDAKVDEDKSAYM